MDIETRRKLRLGGIADAWALAGIGAGAIATSPYFKNMSAEAPMILAGGGAAWLTDRMTQPLRDRPMLKNNVKVKSSRPVLDFRDIDKLYNSLLFGYCVDTGLPVYLPYEELMRHIFILGQSGVGKTVLMKLMMFQQIIKGGPLVFIDGKMKREDLEDMYQMCAYAGRSCDLLVLNPGDPEVSNTYNPILYGEPEEIASRIMTLAPSTENSPGADHYRMSALQGVQTFIGALKCAGLAYNFIDLVILLMNSKALIDLENTLLKKNPHANATIEYRLLLDRYRYVNNKTGESNIDTSKLKDMFGGMAGRLFMFGSGSFGKVMNTYDPEVKLFEAMRSNKIIYVQLPTMNKNEQALMFAKMFMADFRTAISWLQALPESQLPWPPILGNFDEAGSYVNRSWDRPFEQGRSARLILSPAAQTIANFEAVDPELAQMVIGNTTTKIFFRLGTHESAEVAANIIGMKMGITRSLSDTINDTTSSQNLQTTPDSTAGEGEGTSYGERQQEEYLVHPDSLKKLDKGQCIILFEGDKVYNVRVPLIKFDKSWAKKVGTYKVSRFRITNKTIGVDYWKNVNKFLMPDLKSKQQEGTR